MKVLYYLKYTDNEFKIGLKHIYAETDKYYITDEEGLEEFKKSSENDPFNDICYSTNQLWFAKEGIPQYIEALKVKAYADLYVAKITYNKLCKASDELVEYINRGAENANK